MALNDQKKRLPVVLRSLCTNPSWATLRVKSWWSPGAQRSRAERRHHVDEKQVQRYVKKAALLVGNSQASHHLIHCVIPLPRIFCRLVMIFAQCRNCWGTVMFQRRWFIRMFWIKVAKASSALWIIYEAKFIRLGFAGIDQLAFAMGASGSGWLVKLPN